MIFIKKYAMIEGKDMFPLRIKPDTYYFLYRKRDLYE